MLKHKHWFACLALPCALAACDDGGLTGDDEPPLPPPPDASVDNRIVEIPEGDLSGDLRWDAGHTYVLKGYVFVTGGTLTIEPGTTIRGEHGSALTITKDAKLHAVGTADQPITFTSNKALSRPGDWGGVVLLGRGRINVAGGTNKIEGFATSWGERIIYGGGATPSDAHDCGELRYVRILYAGFLLAPGNELNGLTLGGCGSDTEVDFVQSHLGLDDGIEVFGGSVHLRHLVITQPDDDGLDSDLGWTGTAQFVVVQQKPGIGDKGFEFDNHPSVPTSLPRNAPEVWNVTLIGGDSPLTKKQGAMHLRKGTGATISNAIVAFWNQFGVDVDGGVSADLYGGVLSIKHTYFVKGAAAAAVWPAGFDVAGGSENDPLAVGGFFDELAAIGGDPTNHLDVEVGLLDPKNMASPRFRLSAGSPALTGCGTPPAGFDRTATYCGAIGDTDWTAGWTIYPD